MEQFAIRTATEQDIPTIYQFIYDLAVYEKMEKDVVANEDTLRDWLFVKQVAEVLIAEENGQAVGFALYFHNFSTFLGRGGVYLEDLFIQPQHRGKGYGKAMLQRLAAIAVERGCGRLEWACLNWNQPSIDFYLSLGAQRMDMWNTYRIDGERLTEFASEM